MASYVRTVSKDTFWHEFQLRMLLNILCRKTQAWGQNFDAILWECWGIYMGGLAWAKPFAVSIPQLSQPQSFFTPTCLWGWNRQSVLKRWHIKFRCRGITQKKAYNIQNTSKVLNQEDRCLIVKYLVLGLWSVAAWYILWSVWLHVMKLFTGFHDIMSKSFFFPSVMSILVLRPTAPSTPWVAKTLPQWVRQFGCEFEH